MPVALVCFGRWPNCWIVRSVMFGLRTAACRTHGLLSVESSSITLGGQCLFPGSVFPDNPRRVISEGFENVDGEAFCATARVVA